MCRSCNRKCQHQASGRMDYLQSNCHIPNIPQWIEHSHVDCKVCSNKAPRRSSNNPGQFPRKHDKQETTADELIFTDQSLFNDLARGSVQIDHIENYNIVNEKNASDLMCCLCQCILACGKSLQISCEHNFCIDCLRSYVAFHKRKSFSCPLCSQTSTINDVKQSPRILYNILCKLEIECDTCHQQGLLESFQSHNCRKENHTPIITEVLKASRTLKRAAEQHNEGDTIPECVKDATDSWIRKRLKHGTAVVKTGGRVTLHSSCLHKFKLWYMTFMFKGKIKKKKKKNLLVKPFISK